MLMCSTVNVPLNALFDHLFSDDTTSDHRLVPLKNAHQRWDSLDLNIGSWTIINDVPFKRILTYTHAFTSHLVGNVKTVCHEHQVLLSPNDRNHTIVKSRLTMPNLPYGANFCVNISYCLVFVSEQSSQIKMFAKVDFSKTVLLSESITSSTLNAISDFASHLQSELEFLDKTNQSRVLLWRSTTRRPGGPRGEPSSTFNSPLLRKQNSPSPSTPSLISMRDSENIHQPFRSRSQQQSALANSRESVGHPIFSTISNSTTRMNSENTLNDSYPSSNGTPASTTTTIPDDDSQTIFSGKLTLENNSTKQYDKAELFDGNPAHQQQQPLMYPFSHPSKNVVASPTVIQPLRTSKLSSFVTTPAKSAASSPRVSLASSGSSSGLSSSTSSPGGIYARRFSATPLPSTPMIAPAAESHYHNWNGHNAMKNDAGAGNGAFSSDHMINSELVGPRPIAPPRVKFRQRSVTSAVVTQNKDALQHHKMGEPHNPNQEDNHQPLMDQRFLKTSNYNPYELCATGSLTAVVSTSIPLHQDQKAQQEKPQHDKQTEPAPSSKPPSETRTFVHGGIKEKGDEEPAVTSVVSAPEALAPKPPAVSPKTPYIRRNKELPTKVGYRVKMPGHYVKECKPTTEFMADNFSRKLWLENLEKNSLTGMVTVSLLSQLFMIALVVASAGDIWLILEWAQEAWKIVVWLSAFACEAGGKGLTEAFGWFGQWMASQLGYVPGKV
ncbi:hypothetical protein BDR26DRAFT_916514 [Obelidium mucronatum]|nr:hypothetical protein BDR26DRAFT_916514 [Obelidium mucronatum]